MGGGGYAACYDKNYFTCRNFVRCCLFRFVNDVAERGLHRLLCSPLLVRRYGAIEMTAIIIIIKRGLFWIGGDTQSQVVDRKLLTHKVRWLTTNCIHPKSGG